MMLLSICWRCYQIGLQAWAHVLLKQAVPAATRASCLPTTPPTMQTCGHWGSMDICIAQTIGLLLPSWIIQLGTSPVGPL